MTRIRLYDILCFLIASAVLAGMYIFPDITKETATEAVKLCITKIIPTLFPFITATRIFSQLSVRAMYKKRKKNAAHSMEALVIILGLLSGFPGGAVIACEMYRKGMISKDRTEKLVACSNAISPAFCISLFGNDVLNSRSLGIITFLSIIIVNVILYGYLAFTNSKELKTLPHFERNTNSVPEAKADSLSEIITGSFATVLNISAFVTFFMCISKLMLTGCSFLSDTASSIPAVIASIIEITGGLELICRLPFATRLLVGNSIIGFGGISAIMQVVYVCEKNGISPARFIKTRIFTAAAVPITAVVIISIIPESMAVFSYSGAAQAQGLLSNGLLRICGLIFVASLSLFVIKMRKEYKKSKFIL